jgi:replicative DNA helicase
VNAKRRQVPNNIEAEESLIGACLLSVDAIDVARTRFDMKPEDFYKPSHGEIFSACVALRAEQSAVDLVTVSEELRQRGSLDKVGGRKALMQLQANTPASANAHHYARTVAELAAYRRAIKFATDFANAAYDEDGETLDKLLNERVERTIAHAVPQVSVDEDATDVNDLLATEHAYDWIVEGLIERGDWTMFTGGEGGGKTTLIRQIDVAVACGIHPFTLLPITPRRVLHLDFQDTAGQNAREFEKITSRAGVVVPRGMLSLQIKRDGVNLLTTAAQSWIEAQIEKTHAEIVSFGPLYKIFQAPAGQKKHDEEVAERVAALLDGIAEKYGVAFLIEAHAPHGHDNDRAGWRPYGASLWQRHPNFGFGLSPIRDENKRQVGVRLRRWREDRDVERQWPTRLFYGTVWPWEAPREDVL